jgi:hypothetical protein
MSERQDRENQKVSTPGGIVGDAVSRGNDGIHTVGLSHDISTTGCSVAVADVAAIVRVSWQKGKSKNEVLLCEGERLTLICDVAGRLNGLQNIVVRNQVGADLRGGQRCVAREQLVAVEVGLNVGHSRDKGDVGIAGLNECQHGTTTAHGSRFTRRRT